MCCREKFPNGYKPTNAASNAPSCGPSAVSAPAVVAEVGCPGVGARGGARRVLVPTGGADAGGAAAAPVGSGDNGCSLAAEVGAPAPGCSSANGSGAGVGVGVLDCSASSDGAGPSASDAVVKAVICSSREGAFAMQGQGSAKNIMFLNESNGANSPCVDELMDYIDDDNDDL